jgi:hypothetical protein
VLGFLASVVASAVFATPVALGPAMRNPGESAIGVFADPVSGAWIQYAGPQGEELDRISERGLVSRVTLPATLRGEELDFTPLSNGWALATAKLYPGGPSEYSDCNPDYGGDQEESLRFPARSAGAHGCGELVTAQRSPSGRWTPVRVLRHSFAQSSGAGEPVLRHGRIEMVWGAEGEDAPLYVAEARPGKPFGPAHVVPPALHTKAEHSEVVPVNDKLYLRAEFGPHKPLELGDHVVERRLFGSGKLGSPHFLASPLLRELGETRTEPDGSQLFVYQPNGKVLLAHRARWAPRYEPAKLIARVGGYSGVQTVAESGWAIVSLDRVRHAPGISAALISPTGKLGPTRLVESAPGETEGSYKWSGAIDGGGDSLFAITDEAQAGTIWARVAATRCPHYSPRLQLTSTSDSQTNVSIATTAGPHHVFHIAWIDDDNDVMVTTLRVVCARN